MRKNIAVTTFIFLLAITLTVPLVMEAKLQLLNTSTEENIIEESGEFGSAAGFAIANANKDTALKLVGTLINTFLGLLGILFLILIIYGGFKWMNAQGAEEDVTKAKNILTQAVIGLVIIMAAYAISKFVFLSIKW